MQNVELVQYNLLNRTTTDQAGNGSLVELRLSYYGCLRKKHVAFFENYERLLLLGPRQTAIRLEMIDL